MSWQGVWDMIPFTSRAPADSIIKMLVDMMRINLCLQAWLREDDFFKVLTFKRFCAIKRNPDYMKK